MGTAGGVAYPGFNDYYAEGGVGNVVAFEIPHNNGQTLDSVLDLAEQYSERIDFLQLATFNDFGEGTMFEPTIETGFDYLKQVQQFTGVPYGEAELQFVYRFYLRERSMRATLPYKPISMPCLISWLHSTSQVQRSSSIRLPPQVIMTPTGTSTRATTVCGDPRSARQRSSKAAVLTETLTES